MHIITNKNTEKTTVKETEKQIDEISDSLLNLKALCHVSCLKKAYFPLRWISYEH